MSFWIIWFSKDLPWSLCIRSGTPNFVIHSRTKSLLTVFAVGSRVGMVMVYFVKTSVNTRTFSIPDVDFSS